MAYKLTRREKAFFRKIAGFYGCKVMFNNIQGGMWTGRRIEIGECDTFKEYAKIFCHELAHFVNWKTKRYPIYHDPKNFNRMNELFSSFDRMVRYSLNAEICTEKVGKELCKFWFPNMKYEAFYKNDDKSYWFMYGYYLKDW